MKQERILILVVSTKDGFGFTNQAVALAGGLSKLKIVNQVIGLADKFPEEELSKFNPTTIISVGSWHSYPELVEKPLKLGYKVIPWLVSDDSVDDFVEQLNNLDFFLTTSKHCMNVFVECGVKKEKIKILYETVESDFWREISNKNFDDFLRLISVNEGEHMPLNYDLIKAKKNKVPILFTTGGDATNKGAQEILKALSLLNKNIPWIYIIKTWPSPGSFKKSIDEFHIIIEGGMWEKVRYFSGEFSKEFIRNLMNVCDIYVACSRSEGFGLPLVEAQLCGRPVITMKGTSTQEVVEDGVGGLFCKSILTKDGPRADIEDLSNVLSKMITNQKLRESMGDRARQWAISKFASKKIASELLNYIK